MYPMCECASTSAGITAFPVRSTVTAPAGISISPLRPTWLNRSPSTRKTASSMGGLPSPTIRRAPSNTVTVPVAWPVSFSGWAEHAPATINQPTTAIRRPMFPPQSTPRYSRSHDYGRTPTVLRSVGNQAPWSRKSSVESYSRLDLQLWTARPRGAESDGPGSHLDMHNGLAQDIIGIRPEYRKNKTIYGRRRLGVDNSAVGDHQATSRSSKVLESVGQHWDWSHTDGEVDRLLLNRRYSK